ncbi:acyl-CoA dehydrogenase family protein [Haploplasma axanthum]|uniref:p-hydroxyphenylacetate 3-hydroxylase, oxygenase component n=2 Tax=Haploplasma axanthum TaxID=29552 RepID=A0A449BD79_HAPAX|nr:acyl-CoA dehydrogenase family protein [Haploplasma axanthum]VEU80421.1 p-hydroxyphenylacetate 3-hydroxylase, oxygenase component [Haploplasma axanthum]
MFLKDELLEKIRERASYYDENNLFPEEDYKELKEAGYYRLFAPKNKNGFGYSLKEVAREQTRLAMYAPATALGINMHQIIAGVGNYLVKHGNEKGNLIIDAVSKDQLIAFGISEPNNDKVLFGSISEAIKKDNDYLFKGQKIFVSLAKKFDKILTYANDSTGPWSVFAILDRSSEMEVKNDWNTLGMRGTQSNSIYLNNVHVKDTNIISKIKPGPTKDPIILGIFAYFEILLAATYHGIGKRALELGIERVKSRNSVSNNNMYSNDKDIRWRIAEAAITLDGIETQIDHLSDLIENDINDPFIFQKLSTIKNKSVETSKGALDEIIRASGGRSYYNDFELSRLYRDVLAGIFQPSDQESLHNAWANALLGPIK